MSTKEKVFVLKSLCTGRYKRKNDMFSLVVKRMNFYKNVTGNMAPANKRQDKCNPNETTTVIQKKGERTIF